MTDEPKDRTLIRQDASSLISRFIERAKVLGGLQHKPTKGTLKELFASEVLQQFLTSQFGIGSGIIINRDGKQSRQTDIVIYDKRIIPPFMSGPSIGLYPVESVVATIEVKTELHRKELMQAEEAARELSEKVVAGRIPPPIGAVFGFTGGIRALSGNKDEGRDWLKDHVPHLLYLCIVGRYSWGVVQGVWKPGYESFPNCHDETKRFLALLLDNVRTHAEEKFRGLLAKHQDWFSRYIRG